MVQFLSALIYFLLLIMSVFLICLVLIQRGKGGGLAGAFGGVGSSSAFGTKAGDVFTRVTMVSAGIWIALNMVLVILSNQRTSAWGDTPTPGSASKSAFTPSDKNQATGKAPSAPTSTTPGGAANPFDALAPANPNAAAPSPLGTGGTTPIRTPEAPAAAKSDMPDPFGTAPAAAPGGPLPAGASPSGTPGNPKP